MRCAEVLRFARNSRDWQQLIEMCRVVDTVLIDQETVYAPRHGNDRLLLGLKGSLNEVLWFLEHDLDLPVKRSNGDIARRRLHRASIHRMIENPIYGGAYAYGKTAVWAGHGVAGGRVRIRRKARSEWLALMPNAHEGCVGWEKSEAIRAMVSNNVPTSRHHGAPKHGDALLAGLIRVPPLRAQADAPILRYEALDPALQLQSGADG